jgi:hypothetical protein
MAAKNGQRPGGGATAAPDLDDNFLEHVDTKLETTKTSWLHDAEESSIDEIAYGLGQYALRGFSAGGALAQHRRQCSCAFD